MERDHSMQYTGSTLFDFMDIYRRELGISFDTFGLCPVETPSRIILSKPLFNVRAYDDRKDGPALLLVPAPIKQSYLWDLLPEVSVVRRCLSSGIRPFLIQWKNPGITGQDRGLSHYCDTSIYESVGAAGQESGSRKIFIAGHSLGGTFAAVFSTLHPDIIAGLITLGAPMHFGPDAGVFAPVVAGTGSVKMVPLPSGNVPGTFLDAVSYLAAPAVFGLSRWLDWLLSIGDSEAMKIHVCVERWTLDEMPLAHQLFEEIVELLYREDRFMKGSLIINGKRAAPEYEYSPVLTVADTEDPVVPARSILPFHDAVSASDRQLLWYEGETGVALRHAGLLAGRKAHQLIWPQIIKWIHEQNNRGGSS